MISSVLEFGLAAGAVAGLLRVAAPKEWQKRKPVGCNACLGTWTTFGLYGAKVLWFNWTLGEIVKHSPLHVLASAAVAMVVLALAVPPAFDLDSLPKGD